MGEVGLGRETDEDTRKEKYEANIEFQHSKGGRRKGWNGGKEIMSLSMICVIVKQQLIKI